MKKLLATLVTLVMIVSSLAVLTSCGATDGVTPTIGENGNWFIGETDTGVPATGPKGDTGNTGAAGPKGDTGVTGPAGTDGAALEAPTFRYNEYKARYEYSFDGLNWIAIEEYDPASPLRDTTLTSYSYPMEYVTPAEGTILDSNGKYEVVDNGKYSVALIDITGCVFDKVTLVANAESGRQPEWCFLTEMPTLGQVAPFCDGYTALVTPDDETATEVTVEIPEDATVLAVYYQDYVLEPAAAAIPVCPSSITFLKDAPTVDTTGVDPNLLDDTLESYSYPMNTLEPVEGAIPKLSKNPDQIYTDDAGAQIVFIKIAGTVFDEIVMTLGTVDGGWTAIWFLTEMPTKGEPVSYAGDQTNRRESSGAGRETSPISIPEDAAYLAIYYSDPGYVYCPTAITFQKAAVAE